MDKALASCVGRSSHLQHVKTHEEAIKLLAPSFTRWLPRIQSMCLALQTATTWVEHYARPSAQSSCRWCAFRLQTAFLTGSPATDGS